MTSDDLHLNELKSRILEPVLFGVLANILINFCFNPQNPDFIASEFFIAILLATTITETNRIVDTRLNARLNWLTSFKKRLLYHIIFLSTLLLVLLNTLGHSYMWLSGETFHSLDELVLINILALGTAIIMSFVKWGIFLHQNWYKTTEDLKFNTKKIEDLNDQLCKTSSFIELIKGNDTIKLSIESIRIVELEFGMISVFDQENKIGIYKGSLYTIEELLPDQLFFRASRNIIIHKDTIKKITTSTYGKIDITLLPINLLSDKKITISRLKASTFRKWHSNSITNL